MQTCVEEDTYGRMSSSCCRRRRQDSDQSSCNHLRRICLCRSTYKRHKTVRMLDKQPNYTNFINSHSILRHVARILNLEWLNYSATEMGGVSHFQVVFEFCSRKCASQRLLSGKLTTYSLLTKGNNQTILHYIQISIHYITYTQDWYMTYFNDLYQ